MLTVAEAQSRVLARVSRAHGVSVPLMDALGRNTSTEVLSPMDLPPWDNSSMDGYAVRAEDLAGHETVLRLNEVIAAGSWPSFSVESGTASAIMTGAPMPLGADAVVMVEDTDGALEGKVAIRANPEKGSYVRKKGEEIRAGDALVPAGTLLTAAHLGLLASVGCTTVNVAPRPRVGILSTGDEVVLPGSPLAPGQIYSANNATLSALTLEAGAEAIDAGQVPDRLEDLLDRLEMLLSCDVILTSGGVSVGAFDVVKQVFECLHGEVDFWRVKMKPGKPLAFGHLQRPDGSPVPLFGLPGNPVSCAVNFHQFVRPWLRKRMGDPRPFLPEIEAITDHPFRERPGRECYLRVSLEIRHGQWFCRSAGSQSSAGLPGLAAAHGYLVLPAESHGAAQGERVRVQVFNSAIR